MTDPRPRPLLMDRIARASARIDPGLSDRDFERLTAGAHRRRRGRTVKRVIAVAGAIGVSLFALFALRAPRTASTIATGAGSSPTVRPVASAAREAPSPSPTLRLADGSSAAPLEPGSTLTLVEESSRRVAVDLGRGRARFDVVPAPARSFSVRAGDVTVFVVGTVFTVERVADRVGVAVERGRVRVDWGLGRRQLDAGESGWFPPLVVGMTRTTRDPTAAKARAHPPRLTDGVSSPATKEAETAEALLVAADAARLGGHADEGAALLRQFLADHGGDARAPLAAFTLGRVLLIELGQPREAAAAFSRVRTLAPRGPFAEDALAREVEAWKAAGDAAQARTRARQYLRLYPGGLRAEAVRSLGDLE
jgi:transmembrane sensor